MSRSRLSPAFLASMLVLGGGFTRADTLPAEIQPTAIRPTAIRPTWECLPANTAVMVRLPDAAAFLDTIRSRTRFGAMLLEPRRLWDLTEALGAGFAATADADDADLEATLAKYGLSPADLTAGLAGDTGMAVIVQRRDVGRPPLVVTLAWTEPGADVVERLMAAVQRRVEEEPPPDTEPVKRVDLSLAGHEVTWLSQPVMRPDLGDLRLEPPQDAAALRALQRELLERAKTAPRVLAGRNEMFITRIGGRIVAAQTATLATDADADDAPRTIFEHVLAAHAGDAPAPLAERFEQPGARAALPAGQVLADIVIDPRPFLRMLVADEEEAQRRLRAVGLDELGTLVWRHAFAEGCFRQGVFLELPAPRHGLARILDQDCDPADVPSFATSEVADLTQISLDLGKAYATVREFAVAEGGEQAANMFATGEMQTQGWLGIDLPGLLSALGSRHWIVTYPTRMAAALAEARKTRTETGLQAMPGGDRVALVWQLLDEAPFVKLLQRLAPLAGGELEDEQGFRALRLPGNAAVFVGRNHGVVAVGEETAEATLSAIRNPPAGATALRESEAVRRAAALVADTPARVFSVGDATRDAGFLGALRELAASLEPDDVAPAYRGMLTTVQRLLPAAAEMEGVFGASSAVVEVTPAGIAYRSAWEMPAP